MRSQIKDRVESDPVQIQEVRMVNTCTPDGSPDESRIKALVRHPDVGNVSPAPAGNSRDLRSIYKTQGTGTQSKTCGQSARTTPERGSLMTQEEGRSAAEISAADCDIFVDLADFIDINAEIQRISREVAKLETVIKAKRGKLGNEKFVANAPPQIVDKEREQLAEFEDLRSKQDAILSGLRARKPGNDSP